MVFRCIIYILYILTCICFTDGQNVIQKPPAEACLLASLTTISLQCPQNYVPIVRRSVFGISNSNQSCTYQLGDCTADATNLVFYTTDSVLLNISVSRRRLRECNDAFSTYARFEYDCVPITMDDTSKEYTICQNNTDITSNYGIIRSRGHPSQVETTPAECVRTLSVPQNKAIRLWLSDAYIGSFPSACTNDYIVVNDGAQSYRHCNRLRFAYPYLCSSRIQIRYYAKTSISVYRGVRMYFEVVDRLPDDLCSNSTGTVTPSVGTTALGTTSTTTRTTTTRPLYAILGVTSPIESFRVCRGQSFMIQCPVNYVVVIVTTKYGVTNSDQCEQYDPDNHCTVPASPTYQCSDSCLYSYSGGEVISSCRNRTATYEYVEYQCIPTQSLILSAAQCTPGGPKVRVPIVRNGRFRTSGYPSFTKMNCTYRFAALTPNSILNFYSLDISINEGSSVCNSNKLSFKEDGDSTSTDICDQPSYNFIYSSCSGEIDLMYTAVDDSLQSLKGAELYVERQPRPSNLVCGQPDSTTGTTGRSTTFTTQSATPLANLSSLMALDEVEQDVCRGSIFSYSCPFGFTFMILDAYYGVKRVASNKCGFVQGDCVQEAFSRLTQCRNDATACYIAFSTQIRLAKCQDAIADYLHINFQCVPSRSVVGNATVQAFGICDNTDSIFSLNGIVTSPNFPTYTTTNDACSKRIVGIPDRMLKIWINEIAISNAQARSSDEYSNEANLIIYKDIDTDDTDELELMYPSIRDVCVNDYLIINAPNVAYIYCGANKLALPPLCASSVEVRYRTTAAPSYLYKGVKFYFEWTPRPPGILCGEGTISPSSTTPIDDEVPDWAQNLQLSPELAEHVCLGTSKTIRCPRGTDYVISTLDISYAVTPSGQCEVPSSDHCLQEASLDLSCSSQSCFVEYILPKPLSQCGSRPATYINVVYQCIPTRLPNNENPIDICGTSAVSTIALDSVLMVTPQYPTLSIVPRTCSKIIEAPLNKLWKIYTVDLNLPGSDNSNDCSSSSLTMYDGNATTVLCGSPKPELITISCSNRIDVKFTKTQQTAGYRGFKLFSQSIDVPDNWSCQPDGFTTTTRRTTSRPPSTTTVQPPSTLIAAIGGTTNDTYRYCVFPFNYQSSQQTECLTSNPPTAPLPGQPTRGSWCALTNNYDNDLLWGFCDHRITDSTLYDVCRSQSQILKCPPKYVIDILTADYAAKPDGSFASGSCVYASNDCFQNDAATFQSTCAGQQTCTVRHFPKSLTSCQNRQSAYLHIDYVCIPNQIPDLPTYDICNNASIPNINTIRGYLISPNFPNTPDNFDCLFNLQAVKPNQDIYVFILSMGLFPSLIGQSCTKDRLLISSDNNILELCGASKTNFLLNTCHASVSFQLTRAADVRGSGVKFFFEFRERLPGEYCPPLITTTRNPITTVTRTSTTPPPPAYFPGVSPRSIKTLCFPDYTSLFGNNNFQCPLNYVIVIHRAFYGQGTRCDYTVGDCVTEADNVYRICSGKQKCSVAFSSQVLLPECSNGPAKYLLVEYQCIPIPTVVPASADLCTGQISDMSENTGVLLSPSYPSYTQGTCPNVTLSLTSGSDYLIYMFLLDLDIDPVDENTGECTSDFLSLTYQCNNQSYDIRMCGTRQTQLLFSTCSVTDKIFASYNLLSGDFASKRGFALLYNLISPSAIVTSSLPPIVTTTPRPTTTTLYNTGPISTTIQMVTRCAQQGVTIGCDQPDFVLVIHKVQLTVSTVPNSCTYLSTDCFQDRTNLYNTCGGKTTCYIYAFGMQIPQCNNSRSSYIYIEYQCIPKRPKLIRDICNSSNAYERVDGGAIISSVNYTSESRQCKIQLQSNPLLGNPYHKAFKVYILSLNLPMRPTLREQGAQCVENDPSIEIDDQAIVTRLCGNSHTRYLLETCASTIEIRYNNFNFNIGTTKYKGFEIYLESIQNNECRTQIPATESKPLEIQRQVACGLVPGRETVNFRCTQNHGLVFLQSFYFVSKQPGQCDVSQYTCYYPSEQPQSQCAAQGTCLYTHSMPVVLPADACQNSQVDSTEFYYQCLPMRTSTSYRKFQFCSNTQVSEAMGFIDTPNFPTTYESGRQQCSLTIRIPNNLSNKTYSIYLYAIEVSLRDISATDSSSTLGCYDSIKFTVDDSTYSLCGKIDQPILYYSTNQQQLKLDLNISEGLPFEEWSEWQGARLFYIISNQTLPTRPSLGTETTSAQRTTKTAAPITKTAEATEEPPNNKSNRGGLIAGIVIAVLVLVAIIGFFLYRRHKYSQSLNAPPVKYEATMGSLEGFSSTGEDKATTTSIPKGSFKGLGKTTIVSPFYKSTTIQESETQNTTDA